MAIIDYNKITETFDEHLPRWFKGKLPFKPRLWGIENNPQSDHSENIENDSTVVGSSREREI